MARRTVECTYCGTEHASVIAATLCCDPGAFNPADPDDNPDILRSSD